MEIPKEVQEKLKNINFDSEEFENFDDFRFKVLTILSSDKYIEQMTDLSMKEVKLLTQIYTLGKHCNDTVRMDIFDMYIRLKVSKDRKGRSAMESIGNSIADFFRDLRKKGYNIADKIMGRE